MRGPAPHVNVVPDHELRRRRKRNVSGSQRGTELLYEGEYHGLWTASESHPWFRLCTKVGMKSSVAQDMNYSNR